MSDLIDRQLVLDRINKQREHLRPYLYSHDEIVDSAYRLCAEFVEKLPSAQPEIIRCKDCKFYTPMNRETKTGICGLTMHQNFGDNWYCAGAERRTDD